MVKDSKVQRRWQPVTPRQEQRQCRGGFCVPALGQTPVVCHLPTAAACQWLSAARLTEAAPLFTPQWWRASSASGENAVSLSQEMFSYIWLLLAAQVSPRIPSAFSNSATLKG